MSEDRKLKEEQKKIKGETRNEILKLAQSFNFAVETGSSGRCWLKAASVYLWTYILASVDETHRTDQVLLQSVKSMLQYLKDFFYGQLEDKINATIPLPTRKIILSLKRLSKRLTKHSHSFLSLEDFTGNSILKDSLYDKNWERNSYLLIGLINIKSIDGKLCTVLSDGVLDIVCFFEVDFSAYLNSIVLLPEWNFIPTSQIGHVEVVGNPIVLFNFSSVSPEVRKEPLLITEVVNKGLMQNLDSKESIEFFEESNLCLGTVDKIISHNLAIFTLAHSDYTVMCSKGSDKQGEASVGMREGCVVVFRVVTKTDQNLLISHQQPEVCRHSRLASPWKPLFNHPKNPLMCSLGNLNHVRAFEVGSLALALSSMCGSCDNNNTSSIDQAIESTCFNKLINITSLSTEYFCKNYVVLSLNEIKQRALDETYKKLPSPNEPEYWSYSIVSCDKILSKSVHHHQKIAWTGLLCSNPTSGRLSVRDATSSYMNCLFLDDENTAGHNELTVMPCTTSLNKLVALKSFVVVVERRWEKRKATIKLVKQSGKEAIEQAKLVNPYEFETYLVANNDDLMFLCEPFSQLACTFKSFFEEEVVKNSSFINAFRLDKTTAIDVAVTNTSISEGEILIFIISNTNVSCADAESGFNVICWKVPAPNANKNLNLTEYVITFKNDARRWKCALAPGTFVHLTEVIFASRVPRWDHRTYKIVKCQARHFHDAKELIALGYDEDYSRALRDRILKKWQVDKWNDFCKHVFQVEKILVASELSFVNVCGIIKTRATFEDGCYGKIKTRLELCSSDQQQHTFSVYFERCPTPAEGGGGLIPGAKVIFYHLKAHLSKMGHIYGKFNKNSTHRLVSLPVERLEDGDGASGDQKCRSPDQEELMWKEQKYLHELVYAPAGSDLISVSIRVSRILEVSMQLADSASEDRGHFPTTAVTEKLCFEARCSVDDGSARATLYTDSPTDFCQLADITPEAWREAVDLLHDVPDRTFAFTYIDHGPHQARCRQSRARLVLHSLFRSINTRVLPLKRVIARRRQLRDFEENNYSGEGGSGRQFIANFHRHNPMCSIQASSFASDEMPAYSLTLRPLALNCMRVLHD